MYKPDVTIQQSRIKVLNEGLFKDSVKTYAISPITSGDSTITAQNVGGVTIAQWIVIGSLGSEKTELVRTHASTAPTGTTITLDAGYTPLYDHPRDTYIYVVGYDQVEFSRAATATGAKSVLATSDIDLSDQYTIYNDGTNSTGFAFARFKNSASSTYSQYSDVQEYASIEQNKVGNLIDRILRISPKKIPREDVFDFIKDALTTIFEEKARWSFEEATRNTSNTYSIGQETFTLPSDIKENKNEYIEWIGSDGRDKLTYVDVSRFNDLLSGVSRTTLSQSIVAGATTLYLTDTINFASSGTGYIGTDAFTWTGVDHDTKTLTGVSGILDHDSGTTICGSNALGLPRYWTIWSGAGRLFPAPDSDNNGRTLVIEYYKDISDIDSENDSIPTSFWGMIVDYALMRIAERQGEMTTADRYEKRSMSKLMRRVAKEKLNSPMYLKKGE